MGYKETMARTWEREKRYLKANLSLKEIPETAMREKGIQFLCSWSEDIPNTCERPAIRLHRGDALCNYHFLDRIGAIRDFENSAIDNIKQAEEFKIRLDNLHGSKENELALNMAKYSLLREAGWNLRHYKEIPSLNKVASGEIKIDEIGTERREALKEALEIENQCPTCKGTGQTQYSNIPSSGPMIQMVGQLYHDVAVYTTSREDCTDCLGTDGKPTGLR